MIYALLLLSLTARVVIGGEDVTEWTPEQLWARSDAYFHEGDYRRSVQLLDRVIALDPGDVEAYAVSAWLIWSGGDERRARQYLERAIAANPESWEAAWELGVHLSDRVGNVAAALPWLERAAAMPGASPLVPRTLAHAYLNGGRASEAVAVWQRLGEQNLAPPGVVAGNLARALRGALSSDAQALSGGVRAGAADPQQAPVILRDQVTDADRDGFADQRVIDLDDPRQRDGVPDYRIVYRSDRRTARPDWRWVAMLTDPSGTGAFLLPRQVVDSDGDGLAESLPSLEVLRRERAAAATPTARRFTQPDRFELGVDSAGAPRPILPRVRGGKLQVEPRALVAGEIEGLAARLVLRNLTGGEELVVGAAPLAGGVYVTNEAGGPALRVEAEPAAVPHGRWLVGLELAVDGAVVDRKTHRDTVLVSDPAGLRLERATPDEAAAWDRDPAEADEPAEAPGQPGAAPHRHDDTATHQH